MTTTNAEIVTLAQAVRAAVDPDDEARAQALMSRLNRLPPGPDAVLVMLAVALLEGKPFALCATCANEPPGAQRYRSLAEYLGASLIELPHWFHFDPPTKH